MDLLWGFSLGLAQSMLVGVGCWIFRRFRTWLTPTCRIQLQSSVTFTPMTGQCIIMTR